VVRHIETRSAARDENSPASPRTRPVLLFDGSCAFCTSCARALQRTGPDTEIVAWQYADLTALGVTEAQATAAVQWVQTDGTTRSGHEAIAATLNTAGPIWKLVGHTALLPGISWTAAKVYRLVADNRYRLPGGTAACADSPAPATEAPTKSA
jgi:predicted DCC family thiol-disulfide oxidoreductase YuxK